MPRQGAYNHRAAPVFRVIPLLAAGEKGVQIQVRDPAMLRPDAQVLCFSH
jgi:hypothetical protein